MEIKSIKEDMKQIKQEAKEKGLLIKEINKAYTSIKKQLKDEAKPQEKDLVDTIADFIMEDEDLLNSIKSLV